MGGLSGHGATMGAVKKRFDG